MTATWQIIVRVAVTTLPSGSPDGPWIGFWQVAEPSFAIIAVSMNAFRSPFVSEKPGSKKSKKSNGYSSQSSARRRQYGANTVDDGLDLPIMPPSALGRDKKIARYRPIDEEAHLGTHPSERYGPDDFTTYRPADRDSEDIFRPVV
ncbi:hypothetical protein MMC13_001414 [Lambiella insularis]|nr:hypothetical protein [Lambiella insularis]